MASTQIKHPLLGWEMHKRLLNDWIEDLSDLQERRIGELWVQYGQGDDWRSLIRAMMHHKLRFNDCDPCKVDLTVDNSRQYERYIENDRHRRLIVWQGPRCMALYDYLTLDDISRELHPRFGPQARAALKKFLAQHWPSALALKEL